MGVAERGRAWLATMAVAWVATAGCSVVPRSQLEDAHKVAVNLRAEAAQLRDANLALTAQNRDYAERSVDDARRITALEDVNRRLEDSVLGYQKDREAVAERFAHLEADLQRPVPARQAQAKPAEPPRRD